MPWCCATRIPVTYRATNPRWWGTWRRHSATSNKALPLLSTMTSDADRRLLLQTARDAIAAHVERSRPTVTTGADVLERLGGAFVTIHNHGELRGCIGHIEANEPLGQVVVRCAIAACSSDPRFPAVDAS